jgi:hypothetical protein
MKFRRTARATRPRARRVPGVMNKTEARYAAHLDALVVSGVVQEHHFEGVTLKLADDTRYTPDFFVVLADGTCELHEVKPASGTGRAYYAREDAKLKVKIAARQFPFRMCVVWPDKGNGGWHRQEYGTATEEVPA